MIKKLIRTYFIIFHKYPLLNFLPPALIAIITLLTSGHQVTATLLAIALIHLIIVEMIGKKYITKSRPTNSSFLPDEKWFSVLVTKEGEKIILDNSVWAKGQVFDVQKPGDFYPLIEEFLNIPIVITGKFKNTNTKFSGKIQLGLGEDFNRMEVFDKLSKARPGKETLCLKKYLIDIFAEHNSNNQETIDEAIRQYVAHNLSDTTLMDTVTGYLSFPKNIFSNINATEIIMEKINFSFRSEK